MENTLWCVFHFPLVPGSREPMGTNGNQWEPREPMKRMENREMHKKEAGKYIILDGVSGAADGFYFDLSTAQQMLVHLIATRPEGRWAIFNLVQTDGSPWSIGSGIFHMNKLKDME